MILRQTSLAVLRNGQIKGPRHELHWWSSTPSKMNPGQTFWFVTSRNSKDKFLLLLKYKELVGEIEKVEQRCLFDQLGTLRDELFLASLTAHRVNNVPLKSLLGRVEFLAKLYDLPFLTSKDYQAQKGQPYEIREIDLPTRRPKKYSGWVRNSSAVGSKRSGPKIEPDVKFGFEEYVREFNFLEFLTVGELMGRSVSFSTLTKDPIRSETVNTQHYGKGYVIK